MTDSFRLYAKKQYTQYAVGDVDRSMTIASFYVAQGLLANDFRSGSKLAGQPMRRDVLIFLMSDSAVRHWVSTKRFEEHPADKAWLCLATQGLNEVTASYETNVKNRAEPDRINNWISSMLAGGGETEELQTFQGSLLRPEAQPGELRSKSEATKLMASHYKANKNRLPDGVKEKRDEIIALIMNGITAEEAFSRALYL